MTDAGRSISTSTTERDCVHASMPPFDRCHLPATRCGWLTSKNPRLMNHNEKILCSIDRSMRILELGPLTNPIAPKSDG